MSAFVQVTVMEDDDQESTCVIRVDDVYEIEDRETHRVIRREGIDDLFVFDELDVLRQQIELASRTCCGGCK